MVYRNRPEKYEWTEEQRLGPYLAHFQTNPIGPWINNEVWKQEFANLYGTEMLDRAIRFKLLPENIDAALVAGTNYMLGVNVWTDEEVSVPDAAFYGPFSPSVLRSMSAGELALLSQAVAAALLEKAK